MLFLLNPGGKKRRKYRKSTKASRRARSYRKASRTRRRRKTASFLKTMISRFTCGKGAVKRWKSMRRRCPAKVAKTGAPSHGGIAGMVAAGYGPGIIARNRRRRHKFSYRPKSRNYSSWIPDFIAPNPYWIPQYAYNPGATITSKLTEGYKPKTLINALPFAGGFIGNIALSRYVSRWMPGMLQSGLPRVLVDLSTAGLLGAGVGMVSSRYASGVFWGGVTQALVGGLSGLLGGRLFGLGDYATVADAANARSLGGLGQLYDLGSNIISSELTESDPLEDLRGSSGVTPENYNARRIGDNLDAIRSSYPNTPERMEAANPSRLQALNNEAVEGTAMEELMVEV